MENRAAAKLGQVVIAVPVYKEELAWNEEISLKRLMTVLRRYPIIFFVKDGIRADYLPTGKNITRITIDKNYMNSIADYNNLMLEPDFYRLFGDYEYVLIHQLDAIIFHDRLKYFCELGYDYYGARWWYCIQSVASNPRCRRLTVGNGGLSLRHVTHTIEVLEKNRMEVKKRSQNTNEDNVFSLLGGNHENNYRLCPVKVACDFSGELFMERVVKKNGGKLPFGAHAWQIFSGNFYRRVFGALGIELEGNEEKMDIEDERTLKRNMEFINFKRLTRKNTGGISVRKFLSIEPKSLHVLGQDMLFLVKPMTDAFGNMPVFLYDTDFTGENFTNWLNDLADMLHSSPKPALLLSNPYSKWEIQQIFLAPALENCGIIMGKDVYSLNDEYGKYYSNLIKNKFKK